ncbi:MAG: cytochrome c [Pseudomonadota bacterium]|nr:cytochrome c [Pseudomonadota bacterium]
MNIRALLFGLMVAAGAPLAQAEDSSDTKALYDAHCIGCHNTEIYTREDRKITSLPGLERQVRRCETALGLRWFDEEIADMTTYLNEHFYRFKP